VAFGAAFTPEQGWAMDAFLAREPAAPGLGNKLAKVVASRDVDFAKQVSELADGGLLCGSLPDGDRPESPADAVTLAELDHVFAGLGTDDAIDSDRTWLFPAGTTPKFRV
jgi:hypothetical protein